MTAPDPFAELIDGLLAARRNGIVSAAVWLAPFIGSPDEREALRGVRRRAEMDLDFLHPWLARPMRKRLLADYVDRTKARALELAVAGGIPAPVGTA